MHSEEDASTHVGLADTDLPALFQAADESAISHQKAYLWLVRIDLTSLVAGALLSSIQVDGEATSRWLALTGAALLLAGLILTVVLGLRRFDHLWYRNRAVAESVKTLAWRYATVSPPFDGDEATARAEFLERVTAIQRDANGLTLIEDPDVPQLSEGMRSLRAMPAEERLAVYVEGRIRNQQRWYTDKAKHSRRAERNFFFTLIAAQFFAVVSSFLTEWDWNPAGTFAAIAAAVAAWLQVKQHQEIAESYGATARELGHLVAQAE
ncbi:MAG: DUF4231 domain-containing protein, partial [Acidobacteriota bacterium]